MVENNGLVIYDIKVRIIVKNICNTIQHYLLYATVENVVFNHE